MRLLSTSEEQFVYDKNGNLIEQKSPTKTFHFTYDALDRLTKVSDGNQDVTYIYDNFHRRIAKGINSEDPKYYVYFGQREVGFYDPATQELLEYRVLGLGKGAELGASIAIEIADKIYCPLHDHRGNIVCLLDIETGLPQETYRYTAFGESETYPTKQLLNNPWGFMSKRHDHETGFIYFSRRYYAPETGRWITPDPLGFADGPNMYAYVHNNPLTGFDLYGLWDENIDYDDDDLPGYAFIKQVITIYSANQVDTVKSIGNFSYDLVRHPIETTDRMVKGTKNGLNILSTMSVADAKEGFLSMTNSMVDLLRESDWTTISAHVIANILPGIDKLNPLNKLSKGSGKAAIVLEKEGHLASDTAKVANATKIMDKAGAGTKLPDGHMWTKSSPFINKNADELHEMFIKKGFDPHGLDPKNGLGNYINPKNERQYHIDPKDVGRYREPNHVDISRLENYTGSLEKKRMAYKND